MKSPTAVLTKSGKWYCRVVHNGKQIPVYADTKYQAESEALQLKLGLIASKTATNKPLTQCIDDYIESRSNILSPSTIRGYRIIQRNRFSSLMKMRVLNIKESDVRKAVNDEVPLVSAKTLKNSYAFISAVLSENGINIKGVRLPAVEKKQHPVLQPDQIPALMNAIAGSKYQTPILMQLWMGLRRSEVLAIHWEDINPENHTVNIKRAIVQNESGKFEEKEATKTASSNRTLHIPDYIWKLLPEYSTGKIFKYNNPHTYERALSRILDNAGLPNIGTHGLRHTNASIMLKLGIQTKVAMERGGWSSERTMQEIYQHLFNDAHANADKVVDSFFEGLTRIQNIKP